MTILTCFVVVGNGQIKWNVFTRRALNSIFDFREPIWARGLLASFMCQPLLEMDMQNLFIHLLLLLLLLLLVILLLLRLFLPLLEMDMQKAFQAGVNRLKRIGSQNAPPPFPLYKAAAGNSI